MSCEMSKSCKKYLSKYFPPLFYLFCTEKHEHKCVKFFAGFFYGIGLGIAFYYLILIDLNFTEDAAFFVGLTVCLMFGVGIAISSQIRCISLLTFPSFGGKVGRGVLKALVLAYIISGPIDNLSTNGKEVVRVFGCTTSLTFNLTKTRFELMFKPFMEALFGMKTDVNEIKDTLRSIKDVSAPITGEIEDETEMKKLKEENDYLDNKMGDTKNSILLDGKYSSKGEKIEAERFEKQYLKKVETRCENMFTKAGVKCREMFKSGYDSCYEAVTWIAAWLLCWPMKLDFICNIAEALGGASRCDPSKAIDPGFGEGYAYLKNSRTMLAGNFKNVKIQYKLVKFKHLQDIKEARDVSMAVLHDVKNKKELLDKLLVIFKRLLAFIFLRIILNAQSYHDKYLKEIDFDNMYITKYFRKIDARRRSKQKHCLLPLKKIEKKKLVDPYSKLPLKKEREQLFKETAILLLEMITATTFILLDRLFFEALDLINRHAKIKYHQVGRHDLYLEVKGTGMIASLLRSIIKGFNVKKRINIERSNEQCLPKASKLHYYYIYKIFGVYFAVWMLILVQAYTQRLRRVICAYFYRKREKKRVLFLYNQTLKRRIGFFRYMRKKVKKLAREHRLKNNYNICAILRIRYPQVCNFLRIFKFARRKCLICGETEPCKKRQSDYQECTNETCYFIYCGECWNDMGKRCLACWYEGHSETSSGIDEDSDDSGNES